MGNVLTCEDTTKALNDYQEDLKWLSVQNDAIFNDSYLAEVFDNLPEFEGTLLPKEDQILDHNFTPKMVRIKRLVQIFSAFKEDVTCVENFEVCVTDLCGGDSVSFCRIFLVPMSFSSQLLQRQTR